MARISLLIGLISLTIMTAGQALVAHSQADDAAPATIDRFVVITDSHGVGAVGEDIAQWLRERPATKFDFFASGASAPLQWLNNAFTTPCGFRDGSKVAKPEPRQCKKLHTPTLKALWQEQGAPKDNERRISIVALGTNYGMKKADFNEYVAETEKLAEVAMQSSDRCIWIGPPNMTRSPGFDADSVAYKYSIIEKALAQAAQKTGKPACQLIDSRLYSHYPKHGDGIHYHWPGSKDPGQLKAAAEWASGVSTEADCLLALPAHLYSPDSPALITPAQTCGPSK